MREQSSISVSASGKTSLQVSISAQRAQIVSLQQLQVDGQQLQERITQPELIIYINTCWNPHFNSSGLISPLYCLYF